MKFVAYYRVSTERQGRSGLGLEAQQAAVRAHVATNELLAEFTEIESGRNNDRPRLAEAIALARRSRSVLIIAKLDRLARNLAFVANLLESGVEFRAADMPTADKMVIQMMAVVAEHEARMISQRTKSALAAARCRGVRLGGPRLAEAQKAGHAVIITQAADYAAKVLPTIRDVVRSVGSRSVHIVADNLNARAVATRRGGQWTGSAVLRLIKRAGFDSLQSLAAAA